ncbi:MAG: 50S ribosomal protein L29 [Dehalococcoidia bacterium]|nr:50S ribosomal protein L29 [Dehalococcoidia bacterium]MQF99610.1 50S ribosomal protein L29 [SAR202 cluster bacterium]
MDITEIRSLSDQDLYKEIENSRREMMNLRFRLSTRQMENYHELKNVRKTIARLKTIIKERGLMEIENGSQ